MLVASTFAAPQWDAYGLPREDYGPPADEYGPPEVVYEEYGPPEVPHEEYGPPPVPHEEYGPPAEEQYVKKLLLNSFTIKIIF